MPVVVVVWRRSQSLFFCYAAQKSIVTGGRKEGVPGGTEVGWLLAESEEMKANVRQTDRQTDEEKEGRKGDNWWSHIDVERCKRGAAAFTTSFTSWDSFTSLGSVRVRGGLGIFYGTAFTYSVELTTGALTSMATSDTQRQQQRH